MVDVVPVVLMGLGCAPAAYMGASFAARRGVGWWRNREISRQHRRLMDRLSIALRDRPEDFVFNRYVAYDAKTGLSVWTANEDYGFKVWVEPNRQNFGHCASDGVAQVAPGKKAARRILRQMDQMKALRAIREADEALARACAA